MKKILIINTVFDRGGAAKVARSIFEYTKRSEKHDIYFAYGRGAKMNRNRLFKFGFNLEIYLHAFFVRFLGVEGFGTYFSTQKLINFIKKEKFNLIHLHNLHGYYLNFFGLIIFLKSQKIPLIWTLHDEWPTTSLLAYSMDCVHCKTGKGKCINAYTYPKTYNKLFLNFMLKRKQKYFGGLEKLTIVCPSKWLTERVRESYLSKFNIVTIYNGVDVNLFKPSENKKGLREKYNLPIDKKIVLFSASGFKEKRKGIDYVIKTAERLENNNVLFLGVGGGQIPQRNNIHNFGYVSDRKTMSELYAFSDLYIFPSFAEIMPLAPLEAMASGLPVVAFKIGPMKEIITEKEGILVEIGNTKDLTLGTKSILEKDNLRKDMSNNARERVVNQFSLGKMLKNYESLYYNTIFQ